MRKNVLKYDDVMNKQRTVVYKERMEVLKGADIAADVQEFIKSVINSYIHGATRGTDRVDRWDYEGLWKALKNIIPLDFDTDEIESEVAQLKGDKARRKLAELIYDKVHSEYEEREALIGADTMRDIERRVVLATMDRKWREHLYEMDYLKDGIGLRGMGQRDPLVEYQREGYQMYNSMVDSIKEEGIQLLFNLDLEAVAHADEEDSQLDGHDDGELEYSSPADPDSDTDDKPEASGDEPDTGNTDDTDRNGTDPAKAESGQPSDGDASSDKEGHSYEGSVTGMAPISHAEQKVPLSRRPKSEELKTPWADGRTFPGTPKNSPCPCGSGRKYKMCHGQNEKADK